MSGVAGAHRIAVLGPSGSGKSCVARRLARATGLPLVHLDRLAYRPGWQETPTEELTRLHAELLAPPEWIIDGNYTHLAKTERIHRADVAIVLAMRRRTCLLRVLRRTIVGLGRRRPDMPRGCPEHLDLGFLRFCWDWHRRHPDYGGEITRQAGGTPVIVLRRACDVDVLLDRVENETAGAPV